MHESADGWLEQAAVTWQADAQAAAGAAAGIAQFPLGRFHLGHEALLRASDDAVLNGLAGLAVAPAAPVPYLLRKDGTHASRP